MQFTNDISAKVQLAEEKTNSFLEELGKVAEDIFSGALPLSELLAFLWWRLTGK